MSQTTSVAYASQLISICGIRAVWGMYHAIQLY